jgi:hypothetical protein
MNGIAQGELLAHRVSGYYTSSQSSLNDTDNGKFCSHVNISEIAISLIDIKLNLVTILAEFQTVV